MTFVKTDAGNYENTVEIETKMFIKLTLCVNVTNICKTVLWWFNEKKIGMFITLTQVSML